MGLFLVIVVFMIIDTMVSNILPNFSLSVLLIEFLYLFGIAINWIGVLFLSLVKLDVLTPISYFFRILVAIFTLLGGSATDLIFDILGWIFSTVSSGLQAAGLPVVTRIDNIPGVYVYFDLATVTIRLGLDINVLKIGGATASFQFTIFGAAKATPGYYSFDELGFFGFGGVLNLLILGTEYPLPFSISLQQMVSTAFDYALAVNGRLSDIYNELLDFFR